MGESGNATPPQLSDDYLEGTQVKTGILPSLFLLAVVSQVVPSLGFAQDAGEAVSIGERFQIKSDILKETRPVIVGEPQSYPNGEKRYSVLYVLDGHTPFQHVTATASYLALNEPHARDAGRRRSNHGTSKAGSTASHSRRGRVEPVSGTW